MKTFFHSKETGFGFIVEDKEDSKKINNILDFLLLLTPFFYFGLYILAAFAIYWILGHLNLIFFEWPIQILEWLLQF